MPSACYAVNTHYSLQITFIQSAQTLSTDAIDGQFKLVTCSIKKTLYNINKTLYRLQYSVVTNLFYRPTLDENVTGHIIILPTLRPTIIDVWHS